MRMLRIHFVSGSVVELPLSRTKELAHGLVVLDLAHRREVLYPWAQIARVRSFRTSPKETGE
jgi:hypothetical protein